MKVKELIAQLQRFDPELEVNVLYQNEFERFDIDDVWATDSNTGESLVYLDIKDGEDD